MSRFGEWRQPSEWTRSQIAIAAAVGLPVIYWTCFGSGRRKKRHAGPTGFDHFLKEAPAAPGEPVADDATPEGQGTSSSSHWHSYCPFWLIFQLT